MNFLEMSRRITSSRHFDSMQRFAAPLKDLGINHFWYYQISQTGDYAYVGTHTGWSDYCFMNDSMLTHFSCLRHPSLLKEGISLMKANSDPAYQNVLNTAWDKFKINFVMNLIYKKGEGVEAFGIASSYRDPQADERMLNELPLLRLFFKLFKENNKNLIYLLNDCRINLSSQFGSSFYEASGVAIPQDRKKFLHKMGLGSFLLTPREEELLPYLSQGYPASYIAQELVLSTRTVENYIASIKEKLLCKTKVDIIHKAKMLVDINQL